ncbi:hypothetical protein F511_29019 [Dorcoceras hygrometricum]|uniref:Uncharacterized protein n=1 Tax=Dorcoceras hygrometricum TaxID=472368 RepID=A0A2Z7AL84_9LAMI|nr:hypothetical protein F511_29019 [Dorcoceras hygrometricum]
MQKTDIVHDDKKNERYKRNEDDEDRAVDRSKEKSKDRSAERSKDRSKERQMRTNNNKRFSRKQDRKVLMAEESTKSWADSDSESSSSSSSSSESEQEEVHCMMADHAEDDEVFDFANTEFTCEHLVQALNDMVHEYNTLSHVLKEIKAENVSMKNSSAESSSNELENTDSLKTELSRLKIENDLLRNEASELKAEVDKLTKEMSSWNQSTRSLFKLYESQKPLNDKTGVGFNYDSSHGETSTQSQPVYDKFNERSFVKGGVIHDCIESIRYNDQDTSQPDRKGKGKVGVGHSLHSTMASAFITYSYQINFESVLMIHDHEGKLNMFKALEASGLRRFLGCESVLYETELRHFFDTALIQDEDITCVISGKFVSISPTLFATDTEEKIVFGFEKGTSAGDQPPENGADGTNDDESLSIEEHLARIPFHASLPSTLAPPISQVRFGQGIEFRDVDAYTPKLPRIDISDKGKGLLVEDVFQGHPARETFSLICADIEFLITLREKVIEDVSIFVSSFSLRKLASLQSEDIFAKEGQLLSWAETDSSFVAIQRRQFITAKYRELLLRKFIDAMRKNFVSGTPTSAIDLKVLNLLSAAHTLALKDLLRNMKAHQLKWTRPSSSSLFEGPTIDQGPFIPVSRQSISSPVNSNHWEVLPQRPYIDDLAPICIFVEPVQDIDSRPSLSRALRVVWAEICMEAIQFSTLGSLRPPSFKTISGIESSSSSASTVYRSPSPILQEVKSPDLEPVALTDDQEELIYSVEVPHSPSPVVQVHESPSFSSDSQVHFDSADIHLDSAADTHTFKCIYSLSLTISYFAGIPESPSSSSDSQVHFDSADIHLDSAADTHTYLPTASVDFVSLLDALQASLCQRMDDAHNEILSRLHSTERSVQTSLGHQSDYLRRLIEGAQQAGQTQDDIQLLRLNELRKFVMAIDVKVGTDSLDVRNKFFAFDTKFQSFDEQIAAIRND